MKPVDFKLKYHHLCIINEQFASRPAPGLSKGDKAEASILDMLSRKLLKKQLSKQDKDHHKTFKISLEYYEAFTLCKMLFSIELTNIDTYTRNAIIITRNDLDNLLA